VQESQKGRNNGPGLNPNDSASDPLKIRKEHLWDLCKKEERKKRLPTLREEEASELWAHCASVSPGSHHFLKTSRGEFKESVSISKAD